MFLYARRDSSHPLFTDTNFYSPERNYKYYPLFLVLKYNIYPFFLVLNYKNYLFLPERNLSRLGSAPTFSVGETVARWNLPSLHQLFKVG